MATEPKPTKEGSTLLWLASVSAFFISGFLRVPEILIEWIVVIALMLIPFFAMENPERELPNVKSSLLRWALMSVKNKAVSLKSMLHSDTPSKPIIQIILTAIVVGWLLSLLRLFQHDWVYVIKYEAVESILDIIVFFPAFFLIRAFFRDQFKRFEKRHVQEQEELAELRRWEDEQLASDFEADEDRGVVVGSWMPQGGQPPSHSIGMSYLMYPMEGQAAFGIHSIDDVREEMDYNSDQMRADEMQQALAARRRFMIVGIVPVFAGWLLSSNWMLGMPRLLTELLVG